MSTLTSSPPGGTEVSCRLVTRSAEDTRHAAALLGALLEGGEVLGLVGGLGAGKTCFVQGLAKGLGVPPEAYVCSPTFALWCQHQGRVPLSHVDLYRLAAPEEAAFIGYEDLFDGVAVVAIEWFDVFPELWPAGFVRIVMSEQITPPQGEAGGEAARFEEDPERGSRTLLVSGHGARHEELVRRFRAVLEGAGLLPEAELDGGR